MVEKLRKTGINIIGDVQWGTHFCQFYQTKKDLLDILVPYFKTGLKNNEFCMWVTSEPLNEEDIQKAMKKALPGFDRYLERGQIEIIPHTEWYTKGGRFNSQRVLNGWVDKLNQALAKGYEGLRLTGNTLWLEKKDWRKFTDYEEEVNNVIGRYRMIAVCTYSLDKCGANEIIDVVRNHQFALIKRERKWELIESSERKRAEESIAQLASFPEMNPNPIVEVDIAGIIHYLNPAAKRLFPDLQKKGLRHQWLANLKSLASTFKGKRKTSHVREVKIDKVWYEQALYYFGESERIRIYGYDITKRKKMEEALRKSRNELEIWVKERTDDLAKANEALQSEIIERKRVEDELAARMRQRTVLSQLSQRALVGGDLNTLLDEAVHLVAQTLEVEYCKVLELLPDGNALLLRSGVGWKEGVVGHGTVSAGTESQAGYTLLSDGPVIVEDLRTETRFSGPPLLHEHGVVGGMSVIIQGRGRPFGVLGAHTTRRHKFTRDDVQFLQAVANVLSSAIERKRAEEALGASETKYRIVADNTYDWEFWINPDGQFLYSSPSCSRITDHQADEFVADSGLLLRIIHPDDRQDFEAHRDVAEQQQVGRDVEFRVIGPNGTWRWISHSCQPIFDDAGRFWGTRGSNRDITEHKRAQEALHAASLYTRSLIEASLDPLVTISADGKIMDVNKATELATGVPREQLIGSDFSDYFTEPEKAREGYKEVFSKGSVRDYPLAIRHRSGHVTEVLYNATTYKNMAGDVQGVFAAARDITQLKRTEEVLRASEKQLRSLSSRLLSAQEEERKRIAGEIHDSISSSLSAVKFSLDNALMEMERGTATPESLRTLIAITQNAIEESRRIMTDLRPSILDDLGVISTIGWFCREFGKTYSNIRIEKKLTLQEDEVPDPLKIVIFRLIQEAFHNITKYSKAGSVNLCLGKKDYTIELTVKDDGVGFDLNSINFRKGLGLTSMRERTELSGGSFTIESSKGAGTLIRASWPL